LFSRFSRSGFFSMTDYLATKARLREESMARRDAMSPGERAAASEVIAERAEPVIAGEGPRIVSFYWSMRSECDPRPLINRLRRRGMAVALPCMTKEGIVFRQWNEGVPLHPATFGTSEPPPTAPAVNPDFIVLPLLGFDRLGNRLGYGKGHYDRAIAALRAKGHRPGLLGIAFAIQEVPSLPAQSHDVRLHWIATENGVLSFGTD
jgi:5-formyltetrahydrofolate cyclo-ligase